MIREFDSRDQPFTPENLEKARIALTRAQAMDWKINWGYDGHRGPCFDVADIEWLFGYIDHLEKIV